MNLQPTFCPTLNITMHHLSADDWLQWLDEQSKSAAASSSQDILSAFHDTIAIGSAAILDCPSPQVWSDYAMCVDRFSNFLDDIDERASTAQHPPCQLTSEAVADKVRTIFQAAASSLASQASDAFVLWSRYARWEQDEATDVFELTQEASEEPDALEPAAAAALTRELSQAVERVNSVFAAWLAVPSARISEALQALTAWLASPAGSAVPPAAQWQGQLQDAAVSAAERWAVFAPQRERVEAAQAAASAPDADAAAAQALLSAAWLQWVDAAAAKNQPAALVVLDEAVRSAYWDAALWQRYLALCSKLHGGEGATAASAAALCRVARRASRNCMWHVGFWRKYLHSIEWSVARGAEAPLHPFSESHAAARQAVESGASSFLVAAHAVGGEASEAAAVLSRGDLQSPLFLLAATVWTRACSDLSSELPAGPALPPSASAGQSHTALSLRAANKCFKQAAHQARAVGGEAAAAPIQRLWAEAQCSKFNQWDEGAEKWAALLKASPKDAFLCVAAASCAARCGRLDAAHEWLKSGLHFQAADAGTTMWLQQEWQAISTVHGDVLSAWGAQSVIDARVEAAQARMAGRAAAAERKAAKKRARPEKEQVPVPTAPAAAPAAGAGAGADAVAGDASVPAVVGEANAAVLDTTDAPDSAPPAGSAAGATSAPAAAGGVGGGGPPPTTGGVKRAREEVSPAINAPQPSDITSSADAGGAGTAAPASMSAILASLAQKGGAEAVGHATAEATGKNIEAEQHAAKRPRSEHGAVHSTKGGPAADEGPSQEALAKSGGVDSRTLVMVFVNNLPYKATEAVVKEAFASAGKVHQVRLRRDDNGKIRGFGTVSLDPNVPPPAPPAASEGKNSGEEQAPVLKEDAQPAAEEAAAPADSGSGGGGTAAPQPPPGDTRGLVLAAALAMDGQLLLGRPLQVSEFKPMSKRWKDVKASGRATQQDLVLPSAAALGAAPKRKRTTSTMVMVPAALRKKAAKSKPAAKP